MIWTRQHQQYQNFKKWWHNMKWRNQRKRERERGNLHYLMEQNKHKSCIVSNWWSKYILFALLNTKIRKYNHMELKKVKIMRFDVRDEESEYLSLKSFTFVNRTLCFIGLSTKFFLYSIYSFWKPLRNYNNIACYFYK